MKPKSNLRHLLAVLGAATLAISSASAATFTWTALTPTSPSTMDWTTAGNWLDSTEYVSDAGNELIFFADSTTNIAAAHRNITTNVPTTLELNTLTLNGKGASSGASSSNITIGSSASTWTIGDGTTSIVNLNANAGATTAASIYYNVAANLTLNQATTLFTGNGTAGVHTGVTDPGFVFSGGIGQAASGYGITKSGSSRLTLSSGSLTFTGPLTVNGGSLLLTGNSNPGFGMTVNTGAILRIGNNTATQIGTSGVYAGNISTGTGGTLQLWSSSAQEYSGVISGSGGINKAYGGALTLSGANTYTGKTEFRPQTTAGFTVNVSSFNSVVGGTASSSLGAPTTVANGTIDLGSGAAQAGVNLTYVSSATGETTDRVINVQFNGTSDRTITANNASGVLRFTSAFTSNGGGQNGKLVLAGTGAGQIDQGLPQLAALGLDKQGSGTWTLGGSGIFNGPTKITAGTLDNTTATTLQNSPFDTASVAGSASAGLKIATTTLNLGGLIGSNSFESRLHTASPVAYSGLTALTLNSPTGRTSTYSGGIAEGATGMTLTKNGTGTQYLSGTMGYTGATTVNAGILGSNSTFSNTVTVATGAGLAPGASAGAIGTYTISNASSSALTLNGGTLLMDVSTASSDQIAVTGDAVLNGTNIVFLNPTTGVDAGTYDLVTYAATTGSGSVVFANGTTTLGNATLAVNAGEIQMTVGAGGLNNSVWIGTGSSAAWDTTSTLWTRNGTATQTYVAGDFVTINDTATATTITGDTTSFAPASVTVDNSSKGFTISAIIAGTGTPLVKLGTNTLTLSGTNTYTGGTFIGGGRVSFATNANLGDAASGITFNGGELYVNGNITSARTVTLNAVAGNRVLIQGNQAWTNSGAFTGDGGITFRQNPNGGVSAVLTSTSNDFKGALGIESGNGAMVVRIRSLADSASANGNIIFGLSSSGNSQTLEWDSAAGSGLTLGHRQFEFAQNGTAFSTVKNSNTTQAITVNTDLVVSGSGAKTLILDAAAGPTNIFDGDIGNGSGTVAISKTSAGTWVLSGNNSYSGDTTLSAGTLRINSATALGTGTFVISANTTFDNTSGSAITLSNNNAFTLSGGSPTFTGTNDLDLGTGTVTLSGANRTITVTNSGATLAIGGVTTDSSGTRSLTKVGLGTLAINGAAGTWTGGVNIQQGTLRVGNATALGTGPIAFNNGAFVGTLQNTTGSLITMSGSAVNIGGNGGTIATITGTAGNDWSLGTLNNTQAGNAVLAVDTVNSTFAAANLSNSSTSRTLTIQGTGTVTITGAVANGSTSTASALTKAGSGTLFLNGTNTYGGLTSVNGGTLGGSGSIAGAVTVATGGSIAPGTAAGTLSIGGVLNISALANGGTGKLRFDLGPIGSSDQIALTGTGSLTIGGNFLDFSDFTFTALSGLQDGTYKLITSANAFSGGLDTDPLNLTGPVGTGTGTLQFNGNDLELVVTGVGGGPGPLDKFAISAIGSPQTVGAPITGITLTAQDASNQTVTSFNGTVTFGGTGGFSGTSATFSSGVLSGVSITPTNSGTNLTFTVTDGVSGKTGSTTITTIQSQYQAWAGGGAFDADANGDGVPNGLAFLLGAAGPNANALALLPTATETAGGLVLNFQMLNSASRGAATLGIEHSSDLGIADTWTLVGVPNTSGGPTSGVTFTVTPGSPTNTVQATIAPSEAAGGNLFGRLKGVNP
jgi:autotransporter-associated beta strand protein